MLSCQNGTIPLSCFDLMRIGSIRDITEHTGCTCILRQRETLVLVRTEINIYLLRRESRIF